MVISCGADLFTERGETGTPVGGVLNDRALVAMQAYLEKLDIELQDAHQSGRCSLFLGEHLSEGLSTFVEIRNEGRRGVV